MNAKTFTRLLVGAVLALVVNSGASVYQALDPVCAAAKPQPTIAEQLAAIQAQLDTLKGSIQP